MQTDKLDIIIDKNGEEENISVHILIDGETVFNSNDSQFDRNKDKIVKEIKKLLKFV